MLTGTLVGTGLAVATGQTVNYRLLRPDQTLANVTALGPECARWRRTAATFRELAGRGVVTADLAKRAQFADEVLATAAEQLRLGACCVLLAVADGERILGVLSYGYLVGPEAAINLLAIAPEHLPGSPGQDQVRGVGTALVAAASQELLRRGTETVYLHPLDQAAYEFWRGRGFGICGVGGLMCVRGRAAIGALIDGCVRIPDCVGDACLQCGRTADTAAMRLPG